MTRSVHLNRRAARLGVLSALAAVLVGGCALLSTPDPVQLYRFGSPLAAMDAAPRAPTGELRPVSMRRIAFIEAARGDRILAVTGAEASYIAGARWVTPADSLFTEALTNAFSDRSRHARLLGPREFSRSSLSLDLDVRAFEARYDYPGATPVVHVAARARILSFPDRDVADERVFTVTRPASANRVSAIVQAFNEAVDEINGQIVAWTDEVALTAPVAEGEGPPRRPIPRIPPRD